MTLICLFSFMIVSLLLVVQVVSSSVSDDTTHNYYKPNTKVTDSVISLNKHNFHAAINDPLNTLWLLKFYAPWCGHCKKFAPILEEVAPQLSGKMSIGIIDCTKEKSLCSSHGIKGYPTIKIARDGDVIGNYPGSRTVESIISYANKMSIDNPVLEIHNYNDVINKLKTTGSSGEDDEKKEEEIPDYNSEPNGIAFVVYEPSILKNFNSELKDKLQSTTLTKAFTKAVRKKQFDSNYGLLTLLEKSPANDGILLHFVEKKDLEKAKKFGFVAKIEKSKFYKRSVYFYDNKEDDDSEIEEDILNFIDSNSFPTVVSLQPHNFRTIGFNKDEKSLVVGVVDNKKDKQSVTTKRMINNLGEYSVNAPTSITSKYYFTYIDYNKFSKFLAQYNITEYPQIIVMDVPNQAYYQNLTYGGKDIISTSLRGGENPIKIFLNAIENKKIEKEYSSKVNPKDIIGKIQKIFLDYLPWSLLIVAAILFFIVYIIVEILAPEPQIPDLAKIPRVPDEPLTTTAAAAAAEEEEEKAAKSTQEEKKDDESKKDK